MACPTGRPSGCCIVSHGRDLTSMRQEMHLNLSFHQVFAAPFGFAKSSALLPSYEDRRGAMFIGTLG